MQSQISHYWRVRGFTLVELLTALFIASILAGLAAPSFVSLIRSNALTSSSNKFVAALNLAKSEAINRNQRVLVCKRNGTACDNSAAWEDGWIVFADRDGDNTLDAGEEIRLFEALRGGQTLRTSATLNWIAFQSSGRIQAGSGGYPAAGLAMRLCADDADAANDSERSRTLSFNSTGRIIPSKGSTQCP